MSVQRTQNTMPKHALHQDQIKTLAQLFTIFANPIHFSVALHPMEQK